MTKTKQAVCGECGHNEPGNAVGDPGSAVLRFCRGHSTKVCGHRCTFPADGLLKPEAPERVWVGHGHYWYSPVPNTPEYIRADLVPQQAEQSTGEVETADVKRARAIELLRSLRDVGPEEAEEQRETWEALQQYLNPFSEIEACLAELREMWPDGSFQILAKSGLPRYTILVLRRPHLSVHRPVCEDSTLAEAMAKVREMKGKANG